MSTVPTNLEAASEGTASWKQEVNARIAAARAKRQAGQQAVATQGEVLRPGQADSRTSRVAAAVAARYAQAPTYSEYMASAVRSAMEAAIVAQNAAQEAAQRAAEAAQLAAAASARHTRSLQAALEAPPQAAPPASTASRKSTTPAAAGPRIDYAASGLPYPTSLSQGPASDARRPAPPATGPYTPVPFVSDPLGDAWVAPATPLPAKLLEFPRELIAARKARPRHAEGPLREEAGDETQLRIFEVEPEAISTTVEPVPHTTEWSSIRLDAHPVVYPSDEAVPSANAAISSTYARSPQAGSWVPSPDPHTHPGHHRVALVNVASLEDRMMAALVDAALVGIAFLLFAFVFATATVHPPAGRPAVIGSGLVMAGLYLLYQFLFFTFSSGTPGMLYARIALCTFEDDNPTREAMRKRIFALVLAAMPLGLGFLYALFDEDHLGWHDRMTRMYQRSYK